MMSFAKQHVGSEDKVFLAYHPDSSYGPTIWIRVFVTGQLESIVQAFLGLAQTANQRIRLNDIVPLETCNIGALVMCSDARANRPLVKMPCHGSLAERHVEWRQSPDDWDNCAGLLKVFLEHREPGFHFLVDQGQAEHTVVLSYKQSSY
jgi:hypothetical protein